MFCGQSFLSHVICGCILQILWVSSRRNYEEDYMEMMIWTSLEFGYFVSMQIIYSTCFRKLIGLRPSTLVCYKSIKANICQIRHELRRIRTSN